MLDWLKKHNEIKTILFISNQPNINHQHEIITRVLSSHNSDIKFEVVGIAAADAVNTQALLGGFDPYLFAALPRIFSEMQLDTTDPTIKEEFKKL